MPLHKCIVGYILNDPCMIPLAWEKVQTKPEQRYEAASTQTITEQAKAIPPGKEYDGRSPTEKGL